MSVKKTEEELKKFFSVADEWFAKFGEVSIPAHQELKRLLVESIPAARDVKYLVNPEARAVQVIIFVSVSTILLGRPQRLADNVLEILKECLADYEISVEVKRFKKK